MRLFSIVVLCAAVTACNPPLVPDAGSGGGGAAAGGGTGSAGGVGGGSMGGGDAGTDGGAAGGGDGGAADGGATDGGEADAGSLRCPERLVPIPDGGLVRVVAANLSSGNLQSWSPGEGARILQGLKPDVVLMQEWNLTNVSEAARRAWVDSTFGPEFCFHVESGASIPNAVITRWPILAAGQWVDPQVNNRSFAWVRLDVPGPRDLWAVSLHLLTSNPTDRNLEAQALVTNLNQFVPAAALLVIGGDLNTKSRTEAPLQTLGTVVKVTAPHPADQAGNDNTNASRAEPYDWVLADPDLFALQVPVVIGDAGFDAGFVFDSRVFSPLSAVLPVVMGDSAAQNMQHMAVVKDFLLP